MNPLRDKGFDSIGCAPCTRPAPDAAAGGRAATGWSAASTSSAEAGERGDGVRFPVSLEVTGRRCVVFGAGPLAQARATALLEAGASVTVIARPHEDGDLAGVFLAVAATGDPAENARIFAEAEREGVLLNAVDDPAHCHFAVPAVLRRGDLTVTVSTGGRAPGYARRLRDELSGSSAPSTARWSTSSATCGPSCGRNVRPPGWSVPLTTLISTSGRRGARRPRARPDRAGAGWAHGRGPGRCCEPPWPTTTHKEAVA